MKIAIISDTHRKTQSIINRLKDEADIDMIIHLGDLVKDAYKIEESLNIETLKIKGNCDFFSDEEEENILTINKKKILITHGHRYNVKYTLDVLKYRAEEIEADVVLFGHTHSFFNEYFQERLFLNPGSPTQPREGSDKSFVILNIEESITCEIIKL